MAADTHALERQGSSLSSGQRGGAAPRRLRLAGLAALLAALPSGEALATAAERVFAAVSASVVVVEAAQQQGSGVVVAARVVATNCHVISGAGQITVRRGRIGHAASLVRSDRARDVCLLEVPTLEAPSVSMRPAADLRVGAAVYAVGAPRGLELSLSAGLVSQLRESEGGPLIQTTAPVSPGSSGGGLFDERGVLVGLTTLQHGRGQNLNFAVPAEWVASAVNELFAWRRCRAAPEPRCVIEEALAAARNISEQSSRSLALRDIAEAQARAGDIPGAIATAREIADPYHRSRALMSIAGAQAHAGDRQASGRTFASALATAREIVDRQSRSWALMSIAGAQARAGDIPGAIGTSREISDPESRSRALRDIAEAQARAGDRQASARTFASALATAREIADPYHRSRALSAIAEAEASARDGINSRLIGMAFEAIDGLTTPNARAAALARAAAALASARQESSNAR